MIVWLPENVEDRECDTELGLMWSGIWAFDWPHRRVVASALPLFIQHCCVAAPIIVVTAWCKISHPRIGNGKPTTTGYTPWYVLWQRYVPSISHLWIVAHFVLGTDIFSTGNRHSFTLDWTSWDLVATWPCVVQSTFYRVDSTHRHQYTGTLHL